VLIVRPFNLKEIIITQEKGLPRPYISLLDKKDSLHYKTILINR